MFSLLCAGFLLMSESPIQPISGLLRIPLSVLMNQELHLDRIVFPFSLSSTVYCKE